MIKKTLNIGVSSLNNESLNRKIRVSNLISFITIITMMGYIPVAIYFQIAGIIVLNSLFLFSSLLSFYLISKNHYNLAFYISTSYGLFYFATGPVFYGLTANLQFFILIMCLIAIALFESALALRIYIVLAVSVFFFQTLCLKDKVGIIQFTDELLKAQEVVSVLNLLFLFIITIIFFSFFRRENILFQKAILKQKGIIEEHQKETVDSINYAKKIQYALLAHDDLLNKNLNEYFVLFNPKDIVSGDFYWATEHDNKFYLAICDSTGHGVPGAFMSLLNMGFLNEAIKEKNIGEPGEIFNYVRERLIKIISSEKQKDGMDGILICFDKITNELFYAAANNVPILISHNNVASELIELEKDRMPVGKGERNESFITHKINYKVGDTLYLYTDGYADQFGGPKGKKFKYRALNESLLINCDKNVKQQKDILEQQFDNWRGDLEQVDDVLMIGIRL